MHRLNESQSRLLDDMSDGQWHTFAKIQKRNLKGFDSVEDLRSEVDRFVRDAILLVGANDSYRMTRQSLESWRDSRGIVSNGSKDMKAPRYFGGILEDDGWLLAPLRTVDIVHFHASGAVAAQVQQVIQLNGMTSIDFDGLVRVFAFDGQQAYDLLKEWSKEENVDISGIRMDQGVRRRELCDLPEMFVRDLCQFYGAFAHALLRQSMSSVRKHITERDDIQQQIYLWIIDAIQRYDASTSIPFAAYLHSAINRWVHDLNRRSYGRAVADNELQIARAVNAFELEHNRKPSLEELADALGETVEKVRKKTMGVANVNNLRSASTINSEDFDVPLPAPEDSTTQIHREIEQTLISAALTSAAIEAPGGPHVNAWYSIYSKTWLDGSASKIVDEEKVVMASMRTRLADVL